MRPGSPCAGPAAPRSSGWSSAVYCFSGSSFLSPSLGLGGRGRFKRGDHVDLRQLLVHDLESHRQVFARSCPAKHRRSSTAPALNSSIVTLPDDLLGLF